MYDIIVIGAGTAGLTAALYARRAGKTVLVLESENFGGQITSSPRVENYPGISRINGGEFANNLFEQARELGTEMAMEKVIAVLPAKAGENEGKPGAGAANTSGTSDDSAGLWRVVTEDGEHPCRSVIIATGVRHRPLGLAGEEELSGRGISYCALCDGAFYRDKTVAVAGGGDTALQEALFLAGGCRKVYLIHRRDSFRGEARWAGLLREKDNVELILDTVITGLESGGDGTGGDGAAGGGETRAEAESGAAFGVNAQRDAGRAERVLTALFLENRSTGKKSRLAVEGLFVAVGQTPANEAFAGLVPLDKAGYIIAGEDCRTPAPGIFAAGDCRTKEVRQLTTAAADGAIAATAACRWCDEA